MIKDSYLADSGAPALGVNTHPYQFLQNLQAV